MILNVRVENFLVYGHATEFSLLADPKIKKFASNIHSESGFNALKSVCIYGPNNVGKTCILRAIGAIRGVLMGEYSDLPVNMYTDSKICALGITFLHEGQAYSYDFRFDTSEEDGLKRGFIFEKLQKLRAGKGGVKAQTLFVRDIQNGDYEFCGSKELSKALKVISPGNIAVYALNADLYPAVKAYRKLFRDFAERIFVLSMDNIPIDKTIEILKTNDELREKVVELIRLSDLDIDDYRYEPTNKSAPSKPQESALTQQDDIFKLTSFHKGKPVISLYFDSTGTKKMVAVASYIAEALARSKILVVDELDSSLHFKLTRAIVSLFNNELTKAQLIFTAHDVNLLDCKKLLRKDQIRFADKDELGAKLYSLNDFDDASDILNDYKTGAFGALPEPDLISVLLGKSDDE